MKFRFTTSERNGIIALLLLILALQGTHWCLKHCSKPENVVASNEQLALYAQLDSIFSVSKVQEKDYSEIVFHEFDPNTISVEELQALGFEARVAKTILNYRVKVGTFSSAQELFKIYGIDSLLIEKLLPYIIIKEEAKIEPVSAELFSPSESPSITLFKFDPNIITHSELIRLGFSHKTANIFINYREAIVSFTSKEQILNVYGIDSLFYQKLLPFILLPEQCKEKEFVKLEINAATVSDFEKLPGIGVVLANRIVKFRNYLNGFYSIEQLKQVYGLSDETFNRINDLVSVQPSGIQKINLNFAALSELKKIPTSNELIARQILEHRSAEGLFTSIDQLKAVVGEEKFEVMKFYLSIE